MTVQSGNPLTYYVDLDSANNVLGFYNDGVNGDNIPKTAVVITEDQHTFFMKNQPYVIWDGKDFISSIPIITTDDYLNYSSNVRRKTEEKGITLNGISVATDRPSQQMISQTISSLALVPNLTIDWKNPDGSFTTLTGDQIKAFGAYVAIYVASTFTAQKTVNEKINTGEINSYAAIDSAYDSLVVSTFSTKS